LLGDVPILGALFRTKTKVANKTELLIFITPKILSEGLKVN
jgi:type IV pilus assembly protein PilQ